ncbi:MAG: phage holin family protein [Candidatus Paceibacterota bacterium]|jgi:putative membrane protein
MRLLLKWVLAAFAILAAAYLVPGIHVASLITALIVALVLGVLSITIKPVVKLITLPINLLTLGLFSLVVNALFFWLVGTVIKGFTVDGFVAAFLGSLVVSVINFIGDKLTDKEDAPL